MKKEVNVTGTFILNINRSVDITKNITAKNIAMTVTNDINLADGITLKAEEITLTAGVKPELSYGSRAYSEDEGGIVRQGPSSNYDSRISGRMDFDEADTKAVFGSTSKIQANSLQVSATRGIYLGGKNDSNRVTLHNYQESVVYHNVADVDPQESGDVLTVEVTCYDDFSKKYNPVLGNVWVYNEAASVGQTNKTKDMAVVGPVYAYSTIDLQSQGHLTNLYKITSVMGDIYLGSRKEMANFGTIKAEDGIVAVSAGGIWNCADLEAQKSVYLVSNQGIYNGVRALAGAAVSAEPEQGAASGDVHMYAGEDVMLLTVKGLENQADLSAGTTFADGEISRGGDVFMDDYELLNSALLSEETKAILKDLVKVYTKESLTAEKDSVVHNTGSIVADKGSQGRGLVHLDSMGSTENEGTIYSFNGEVFFDSSTDLINHKDIYVINEKADGTSCNVTLQATGNVYNTGDIHVKGKGEVLLDADAMDKDRLDYNNMSADEIASHLKTSTVEGTTFKGVYNTGDIYVSDGDVTLKSMYGGDIFNTDELHYDGEAVVSANGNISIVAPLGNITNTKTLRATKSITIECFDDIHNLPAIEGSGSAGSVFRGLITENGDINLKSNNGTLENQGELVVEQTGNVNLIAKGNITNGEIEQDGQTYTGDIHVGTGKVVIQSLGGEVHNVNGDIYVANGSETSAVEITAYKDLENRGDIYAVKGDVVLKSETGSIFNTDELRQDDASVICSGGSISLLAAQGDVVNTKALVAGKNITIDSLHDVYNLPALGTAEATEMGVTAEIPTQYQGKSVERGLETKDGTITIISRGMITADDGHLEGLVVNKGSLTANNGNIEITANGSEKTNGLTPMEQTDVLPGDLQDGITYSFLNDKEGNMLTNNGNIIITAEQSVVTFGDMEANAGTGEAAAKGNISFTSNSGHAVVYSVDAEYKHNPDLHKFDAEGDLQFKAAKGYVYSDKGMHSKGDMFLEFGAGEQTGEVVSDFGDVTIIGRGVDETHRDLVLSNKISAVNGAITVLSDNDLIIIDKAGVNPTIIGKKDVVLGANGNIAIEDCSVIQSTAGNIKFRNNSGDISIIGFGNISADNGTITAVSAGNLAVSGSEGSAVTGKGNILLDAQKNIVIGDIGISTTAGGLELQSNTGYIDVAGSVSAKGFVRMYTKGAGADSRATNFGEEEYNPEGGAVQNWPRNLMRKMLLGASVIRQGDINITGNIVTDGDIDLSTYDGVIEMAGSGGADCHYYGQSYLDAQGKYHFLYEEEFDGVYFLDDYKVKELGVAVKW